MSKATVLNSALRAEQLGKTYSEGKLTTHVFDGLDLDVAPGQTVAVDDDLALYFTKAL